MSVLTIDLCWCGWLSESLDINVEFDIGTEILKICQIVTYCEFVATLITVLRLFEFRIGKFGCSLNLGFVALGLGSFKNVEIRRVEEKTYRC